MSQPLTLIAQVPVSVRLAGECMHSKACSGAFPFAAAPAQVLSNDLASAIATSPKAINYTESVLHICLLY